METLLNHEQFEKVLNTFKPGDTVSILCLGKYYFQGTINTISIKDGEIFITYSKYNLLSIDEGWQQPSTNYPFAIDIEWAVDIRIEDGNLVFYLQETMETITFTRRIIINPSKYALPNDEQQEEYDPYSDPHP